MIWQRDLCGSGGVSTSWKVLEVSLGEVAICSLCRWMIRPLGAKANMQSIICIAGSVPRSGCSRYFLSGFDIDYFFLAMIFSGILGYFSLVCTIFYLNRC